MIKWQLFVDFSVLQILVFILGISEIDQLPIAIVAPPCNDISTDSACNLNIRAKS